MLGAVLQRVMRKFSYLVNRAGECGLIFFVALLSLLVLIQVVFRYALDLPLFWTEESARYCLVWASLLGAGVGLKRGEHIAITYLTQHLPPGFRRPVLAFSWICTGVLLIVILWGGIRMVKVTHCQISPALQIPMSVPYLAVPVGAAMMLIHLLALFLEGDTDSDNVSCGGPSR
jgi:TRAP-type C4-dicarboxylate transport system permease small subunit